MNFIKIITLFILSLTTFAVSAEVNLFAHTTTSKQAHHIKFATPNLSIKYCKDNQHINKITNDYTTHKSNVSYLSIENNQHHSSATKTIIGNGTNYYHHYSPISSPNRDVTYSNVEIKSYNVANRTPFEGDVVTIQTTPAQYSQFGPPDIGPISDVILPLLFFAIIYLLKELITKKL